MWLLRLAMYPQYFNPRFPRGKRLHKPVLCSGVCPISIHASREGSDASPDFVWQLSSRISIHASREGSDVPFTVNSLLPADFNPRFPRGKRQTHPAKVGRCPDFNPRFPRGKRPKREASGPCAFLFQSTLPAREATAGHPEGKGML